MLKPILFLGICTILLFSCSNTDSNLQKIAQDTYLQRQWVSPLPPKEFKSDGCSCWPDNDWLKCCVEHDVVYWMGGTKEERKKADLALKQCVSSTGHPFMGKSMYYAVRLTGTYWLPTPFRWGYGWKYPQSGPPGIKY